MEYITHEQVEVGFYRLLRELLGKLHRGAWRFWYGAFKKFLQRKPPFVADESDVKISFKENADLTPQSLVDSCANIHGDSVASTRTVDLFLKHAKTVKAFQTHNFVVGTAADLFGIEGGTLEKVFHDDVLIHKFGLEFCEPSDAFLLRCHLGPGSQELGECLRIMTLPLEAGDGKYYWFEVGRHVAHHPKAGAYRIGISETQPQYSGVGQVMVFRLKT